MKSSRIVTVRRTKKRGSSYREPASVRRITQTYFNKDSRWEFVVELALFGLLVGISAWPLIYAVESLRWL